MSRPHSQGYHGTHLAQARVIAEEGFQTNFERVCFAPISNLELAKKYGAHHASKRGESFFGVVHAEFLEAGLDYDANGNAQIEIPRHLIVGIRVIDLLEFKAETTGLDLPNPNVAVKSSP